MKTQERKSDIKKRKRNETGLSKEELRERRKKERKRIVIMQRIFLSVLLIAVIGGGTFAIVYHLPYVKLNRQLRAGERYHKAEEYDQAITAYEKAVKIDPASVTAYRSMAGTYLDMKEESRAKQILFEGWENTRDESLLQYYCTLILNEAVAEINEDSTDMETAEKITDVLEQNIMNEEAIELLYTVYDRLMEGAENGTVLDLDTYVQVMDRLFAIYEKNPAEELKNVISRYGILDVTELELPVEYAEGYLEILKKADQLEETPERGDLIACLEKEEKIQDTFADIFKEFDAGNFEAAKDFIVTDTYTQIRDEFINGTMEYWNGATYIPVSRETVILKQSEKKWTFEFPDFKENENTAGIITVWGNQMTDNGVQRSCIAYEPAKETENFYPHTEYVISYMYSNVQKKNSFDYMMNYHFETRIWTEDDMVTTMIGDWGGPYQWEKTY